MKMIDFCCGVCVMVIVLSVNFEFVELDKDVSSELVCGTGGGSADIGIVTVGIAHSENKGAEYAAGGRKRVCCCKVFKSWK